MALASRKKGQPGSKERRVDVQRRREGRDHAREKKKHRNLQRPSGKEAEGKLKERDSVEAAQTL